VVEDIMARKKQREVPSEVRAALAALLGTDDIAVRQVAQAAAHGIGEVRLVSASPRAEPNVVQTLTVDDGGVIRSRTELMSVVGRDPFVLVVPDLPIDRPRPVRPRVTIDPVRNDWVLNRCETVRETVTVTIPKSGVAPRADVYLLADTTASMDAVLAGVAAASNVILSDPAFAPFDVAWGVGNYRDFPVGTGLNTYAFQHQVSPTTNVASASLAVGTWRALEGADGPEGQLFALDRLANDPAIGWRPDAKRIVVWIGDAPGHDPICGFLSGVGDVTEASVTADLGAAQITVVAIGTTTGFANDLDDNPTVGAGDYRAVGCTPGGAAGQATRLTTATSGSYTSGLTPADVVGSLVGLITTAVTSVGNVKLVATGDAAEFVESITPAGGYGPLPGDTKHVLTFDVVWRGTRSCSRGKQEFLGALEVVADGTAVALKPVRVVVPPCRHHYPVTMICGPQKPDRECRTVEPGHYATLVTIYNPSTCPVTIEKRFAPIALSGDVLAREPKTQPAKSFAKLELGPGDVTMDDCCALREAVGDVDSLIGVLDVIADGPLEVVVTLTTLEGGRAGGHGDDGAEPGHCYGAPAISSRTVDARLAP
jgi:hypothetical protein